MNSDLFSLKKKVALVTGATGYLGKEMCIGLAESGAHVLVNSRSQSRALEFVEYLRGKGLSADSAVFDVCSEKEVKLYFDNISESNGIDIIVNNAYAGVGGTIETCATQNYRDSYEISVTATHNLIVNALPSLRKSVKKGGYASIINIASMYGMVSPDHRLYTSPEKSNPPFYGAAKAALIQLTKYAACEFGKEGIRVNSLSPGPFPKPDNNKEFINQLSNKVPTGRVGAAHEIKGPVIYLASSASSYVNGSNLIVDGGWTAW